MKRKVDLDSEIAADLGVARRKVVRITDAFIEAIRKHLTDGEDVHLDGFGRLHVHKDTSGVRQPVSNLVNFNGEPSVAVPVPVKHKVHFAKAQPFKIQLQERWKRDNAMEKYGVDETSNQQGLEKAAAEGCPLCAATLEKHGSVLICPTHGSAPFEQKSDGDQKV